MIGGVRSQSNIDLTRSNTAVPKINMGNNQTKLGNFEPLFDKNIPHILEKIFHSLDYDSFMESKRVCKEWNKLLSSKSYDEIAKKLLKEKRNENKLCEVSSRGTLDEVRHLLRNGVNPNCYGTSRDHTDPFDKITPIQHAVLGRYRDRVEIIKLLIREGADPNKCSIMRRKEESPLSYAVMYASTDAVKVLLEGGSDPNLCNQRGESPLYEAVSSGSRLSRVTDSIKLLLEAGSDPNKADNEGRTPLCEAAYHDQTYLVKILLDGGANPRAGTPLRHAKFRGNKDVERMLLSKMSKWERVRETMLCLLL